MSGVRTLFLESASVCQGLLERAEVHVHWDEPSALELFSVRGLAGHLVRATGSVEAYLDRPEPVGENAISAAQYYATAVDEPDVTSELHVAIRARGEAEAADGYEALLEKHAALLERLRGRFVDERADRLVQVFQSLVLRLDDYLVTRLVEQLVHADDLAVSVGVESPAFPSGAMDAVLGSLLDVARWRHGDLAVLRAFSRRERDAASALRVL